MKYLYKQIIAFFIVVLITVATSGIIFIRFLVTNIYEDKEAQLFGYAESVIDQNMSIQDIENGIKVISNQDVILAIYDKKDELVYPTTANHQYSSGLSQEDIQRLQEGERISLTERDRGFMNEDFSIVTVYLPLFNRTSTNFSGFVAVASPVSGIQKQIEEIRTNSLLTVLISGGISIIISIGFANYLSRRIVRMRNATREITQGNFDISLENHHRDEFDELSQDFNLMVGSLKDSQQEIERQENLRRQFMMDVAHEMRTPLTTIHGILEGLEHDMIPEKSKERSLTIMHNETRRMIRMVNENLDYEKIRSDQIVLVKQEFLAQDALQNVKEQLEKKATSKGNKIEVIIQTPDMKIYADYDRFIQILVNLTTNAIQFTENGNIHLEAEETKEGTIIKVRDTGQGIDKKDILSIWERYYKADISRKNNKFGESGIGLAIVKSLVKSHQGEIEVESILGKGTTFTIQFPPKNIIEK
ncbi:HAMP domain-containing histidine kinase [Jeotgalibaca sp. MA1X17-3]|uniref:sensor histidine kinase n=1 Tax=Jeotgalibaca sp. MA1X17-3 TaxID=2908211 RepID=UPI001F2F63F2|nr:HAMP domain-containing sensor histidine kinase [Jeotgalibaca sp. MA1X17-3]UJF15469.1 HAMP domain-containing histidine kinase [Jeotgalibaca sp. MA1X17-3]